MLSIRYMKDDSFSQFINSRAKGDSGAHGRKDSASIARAEVRVQLSLARRLHECVDGRVDVLLSVLSEAARRALPGNAEPLEVAELALADCGPAILPKLRPALVARGLEPPTRWNSAAARTFVQELGFPLEFASAGAGLRKAEVCVGGPLALSPLHGYQQEILDDIRTLLSTGVGRRRAVISMPTGAGKTRVAAEAVVRAVLRGQGRRLALWIAQTDELCEQAVQDFRQLWSNIGEPDEDLRIIRLWGGQPNPAPSAAGQPVVVVASIQTMDRRSGCTELAWISEPGIVVIDECHHAIAPMYTDFLRWLNLRTGNSLIRDREPPLLGLSATPWRGYNEEESQRLARRFDNRWLPVDQAGLHDKLSAMDFLAKPNYVPLQYDRPVMLSPRERQHVDTFKELPSAVAERIAMDDERNDLIVDAIKESPATSILLFANSVDHAEFLAARLNLEGCSAAAVSDRTAALARQYFTRRFRNGELRVMCNYGVLASGFDAPKTDKILISRPVFSPVHYMQMVGRGSRGPNNGGTAHCTIMTVEDNIVNYKDQLAYQFCRRYFERLLFSVMHSTPFMTRLTTRNGK